MPYVADRSLRLVHDGTHGCDRSDARGAAPEVIAAGDDLPSATLAGRQILWDACQGLLDRSGRQPEVRPRGPRRRAPRPRARRPDDSRADPTRVASTTSAKWKASAARRGKVFVTVSSGVAPTGTVTAEDRGRAIARATLAVSHQGRIAVRIRRLSRGRHVLVVHYGGSATTVGSSSANRTVTLR